MRKKVLAMVLVASMALGLSACGGGESATSNSNSSGSANSSSDAGNAGGTTNAGSTEGETTGIDTSEHVVINYMFTGDKPEGKAAERLDEMMVELNSILNEKVNAELELYFIGWTDYLSNYNLTLAQMDGSVDLVGTASDWLDAWPNAKNGAFLELSEEMLQTYAPKTWESVTPEQWELCKYNGEIYLMPENNYAQWTNHGFIYRKDWAKDAGLADGCHSWEDMTTYFEYIRKTYPDMIPWDSDGSQYYENANGWIASHSEFVPIEGVCTGALWGGTRDDLYTIVTPAYTDTEMMVEYAKLMKQWDEMGVWKTDVLNNTASSNRDDYRIGRTSVERHHTQTWTDLCSATPSNTIYQDDPDAESGFFYFGEETGNVVGISITHGAMAVSAASENPERALMVYDLLRNDPECYRLLNYGIEGISYVIDENGLRANPEGYNSDTDNINGMTSWWWGRNDELEIRDATKNWEAIDELYAIYDSKKIDYPYGQFVPEVDEIQAKIQNINEVYTNYTKQITFGKYNGTAEEIVAEMQAALKQAGIEEVTAELQAQFDALYK